MRKMILSTALALTMATSLTGCLATQAVLGDPLCQYGCDKTDKFTTHTLFKDTYVAIAKPAKPIDGYPNALLLIGKNSTLILTPKNADDVKFFQRLSEFDLRYLSMYLFHYNENGNKKDDLKLVVKNPNHKIDQVEIWVNLKFSRHIDLPATAKEKQLFADTGFELTSNNASVYGKGDVRFEYGKTLVLNMTAIPALPNVNLTHTFRQPIELEFYRTEQHGNPNPKSKKGLPPYLIAPALVIDVVTLPLQLAGMWMYETIKDVGKK